MIEFCLICVLSTFGTFDENKRYYVEAAVSLSQYLLHL